MLKNVPAGINRMARNVIINHPNTFNCKIYRKTVTRDGGGASGGLPTLGGLGVITPEDEDKTEYSFLDNGFTMQVDQFSPALMTDRLDANNNSDGQEFMFAVELEDGGGTEQVKKHDVVLVMMGDEVFIAYEVVHVTTAVNIPPYVPVYGVNRRSDLDIFNFDDGKGG